MADRLAPLGWHILFHFKDAELLTYADLMENLPVPFVLDHFGGIDPSRGRTDQDTFHLIIEFLTNGNGWIKTSAIERISHQPYPFTDATEIARGLIDAGQAPTGRLRAGACEVDAALD